MDTTDTPTRRPSGPWLAALLFTRAARRALGSRCLKLARLDLRDGEKERALELMDRAIELVPGLRLEAYRIRLVESLRGTD